MFHLGSPKAYILNKDEGNRGVFESVCVHPPQLDELVLGNSREVFLRIAAAALFHRFPKHAYSVVTKRHLNYSIQSTGGAAGGLRNCNPE